MPPVGILCLAGGCHFLNKRLYQERADILDIFSIIITIFGLILFEVVSSIDNAIINAEVLSTMREKARKWFLLWGMLFAVFIVRGLLPWVIIWLTMPTLGPIGSLTAAFSNDPSVKEYIEKSAPILLMGGGTFLLFLFLHWIFLEPKKIGLFIEPFFLKRGLWFYTTVSLVLVVIVWFALEVDKMLAFAAIVGSTAFFITHGFKSNAEANERELTKKTMSDIAKILYLEIIDMTFSVDGVLGAFAFTLSVPLIIIGNGIGAYVVRALTIRNIKKIGNYDFLKNGAMYSILGLGSVMILEGFGVHIPGWITPCMTFAIILYFLVKSVLNNRKKTAGHTGILKER
jgi:hypothetical protein